MFIDQNLRFMVVIDSDKEVVVVSRSLDLELAHATFKATVRKYPKKNILLRHGGWIIRQYLGAPKPGAPKGPVLHEWAVYLRDFLGVVKAKDERDAISAAHDAFKLKSEDFIRRLKIERRD